MKSSTLGEEVLSLLQWTMLAACTIGPGTVVVCSKAGAEYDLTLIWTLVVAAFVSFVLAESAARLTIVSGISFGRALRMRFGKGDEVPLVAYLALIGVLIGNLLYVANCLVGGMAALYVVYRNVTWYRVLLSILTGAFTMLVLVKGDIDKIGQALGTVVVLMAVIFGITAETVEVHTHKVGRGMVPSIPSGSSDTVLSLMSTTAIPFSVFLASSMTGGSVNIPQMKRGIAFSSALTALISILIVVVGSGIDTDEGEEFTVEALGGHIATSVGETAKILFCIGLYAAAFSSAVTDALGASLTAQQIFEPILKTRPAAGGSIEPADGADDAATRPLNAPLLLHVNDPDGVANGPRLTSPAGHQSDNMETAHEIAHGNWEPKGVRFQGTMGIIVLISVIIAAADADVVAVIMLAQVCCPSIPSTLLSYDHLYCCPSITIHTAVPV
jgi:Mn2+/Fe2+ NRAMP family transporter